ncbi:agmatinase [Candidatus Bathyarchaeota archaeon]|nr:agmatinase [Candidatus Bathyarchaeota archaeon]
MPTKGDNLRLYVSSEKPFSGCHRDFDEARYVVLGFPYDRTSTYRTGSALGPAAVRDASANIETYSLRSDIDIEDVKICDVGDLTVVDNVAETLRRLELAVRDIREAGKVPLLIGGEHTLTYGSVRAMGDDVAVVAFDAHLDLRNEYMGERLSHTTFMRRLAEEIGPEKVIEVGTRAVSKDELHYAKEAGITFYSSYEIREKGPAQIAALINSKLAKSENRYITIDIDVLDPAYAPGVGNPEGDGLENHVLIDMLVRIVGKELVGLDLVEVCPSYDRGSTAAQAAKILFEIIAAAETRLE